MVHCLGVRPGFRSRFAGLGCRVPMPLQVSGFGIARFKVSRNVEIVAAHAYDQVSSDDHRRHGTEIHLIDIADLFSPALLSRNGVERNEMTVRSFKKYP